jgi:hypothetical protein
MDTTRQPVGLGHQHDRNSTHEVRKGDETPLQLPSTSAHKKTSKPPTRTGVETELKESDNKPREPLACKTHRRSIAATKPTTQTTHRRSIAATKPTTQTGRRTPNLSLDNNTRGPRRIRRWTPHSCTGSPRPPQQPLFGFVSKVVIEMESREARSQRLNQTTRTTS